jgi:hypothetical protein
MTTDEHRAGMFESGTVAPLHFREQGVFLYA